jgi:hypothetical protein
MQALKQHMARGVQKPVHGNKDSIKLSDLRADAVAFLTNYFEENCDKLPSPSGNTASWHLPPTTTKEDVYKEYREFYQSVRGEEASLASSNYFKKVWLEECPHVSIPERSRFARCNEYVFLVCS